MKYHYLEERNVETNSIPPLETNEEDDTGFVNKFTCFYNPFFFLCTIHLRCSLMKTLTTLHSILVDKLSSVTRDPGENLEHNF